MRVQAGALAQYFLFGVVLLTGMASSAVAAVPTSLEVEPNDTPAGGLAVSAPAILAGSLSGGDQDAWRWTVSDVDALKRWDLVFQGIAGRLSLVEIVRVRYSDNGVDVLNAETVLKLGSRDGARAVEAPGLIFEAGDYVLGIAHDGTDTPGFRPPTDSISFATAVDGDAEEPDGESQGAYRLKITPGDALQPETLEAGNVDFDTAESLRLARSRLFYQEADTSVFRWDLPEAETAEVYRLAGQVAVGRKVTVRLKAADGTELAQAISDRRGRWALSHLGLDAGSWYVELDTRSAGAIHAISAEVTGIRVAGEEAEPNDSWALANTADPGAPVTAAYQRRGEKDFFRFEVTEAMSEQLLGLRLETGNGQRSELCLLDAEGKDVQCRSGEGGVQLEGLTLEPGTWGARTGWGEEGTTYTLALAAEGPIQPGFETEPNDSVRFATGLPDKLRLKGRLGKGDEDWFRILVADEPQLWRAQVMGDGIGEIAYHDATGRTIQSLQAVGDERRLRLDNLFLMPGTHHITVSGKSEGDYTLLLRPLGPPPRGMELEPNDDDTRTQPLRFDESRQGLLLNNRDVDQFRFSLRSTEHIALAVTPPADAVLEASLYWEGSIMRSWTRQGPGDPVVLQGRFPPGAYRLALSAREPSDAEYSVLLERRPFFACPADCEPNDNFWQAEALPPGGVVEGQVRTWGDPDLFRLPRFDTDKPLEIRVEPMRNLSLVLDNGNRGEAWELVLDQESGVRTATVPAGVEAFIQVDAWGDPDYRLQVNWEGQPVPAEPAPLVLDLELPTETVAAYVEIGQVLEGRLTLSSNATQPAEVQLVAAASDHRWSMAFVPPRLTLDPGASVEVAVTVRAPADAWGDRPVTLDVAARTGATTLATVTVDLAVNSAVEPVAPALDWTLPDALLGGINVAWDALGGRYAGVQDSAIGSDFEQIIDGQAPVGWGFDTRGTNEALPPIDLDVALAGEDAVSVAGFAASLRGDRAMFRNPADLEFLLSMDGENWTRVRGGKLAPVWSEQVFALDAPVPARFARLRLLRSFEGKRPAGSLGEFKVIAAPDSAVPFAQGLNLADPRLGGNVVWSLPIFYPSSYGVGVLDPEQSSPDVRLRAGQALQWVVGFHHARAARLHRLAWRPGPAGSGQRPAMVRLDVSVDSPLGPWRPLGGWDVSGDDVAVLELPDAPWARYLRFTVPPASEQRNLTLPMQLSAFEAAGLDGYRSILGEWGEFSQAAAFEWQAGLPGLVTVEDRDNTSRERAAALVPTQPQAGRVSQEGAEHWYRFEFPAGHNVLSLFLEGRNTVEATLEVQGDGNTEPLVDRRPDLDGPARQAWEVVSEAGAPLWIRVYEPPRNVVFAWDTSGSVAGFVPVIYEALQDYAKGLSYGRDAANLMPFGSDLLLADWHGSPYAMQSILNDYPRQESSSAAEQTLAEAAKALEPRTGSKSIILITDAATSLYPKMWAAFDTTRPRIFSLGLSCVAIGCDPPVERDRFEAWSRVNGGHADWVDGPGSTEVAFDRAKARLRRPVPYRLEVMSEFREAPGPGFLVVMPAADQGTAGDALEVILDASGSMLQRLDGARRINIARDMLTQAVTRQVPAGTPFALRVFGHLEPNACRTDLVMPLAPLDPVAATETLAGIQAMNLARTPIADSLAKAAEDLKGASGRKLIVLVTDGEETCEGDPATVVQQLQDDGFDFSLNIVGFAVDDDQLAAQFEAWAVAGDGAYHAADDADGLAGAIDAALRPDFEVHDSTGKVVIRGQVGDPPAAVPQGEYSVVISGSGNRTFDAVRIRGEETTTLKLE